MDVVITQEKCTGCGACARDCLRGVLAVEDGRARVREGYCIRCGHCAAVCPTGAVELRAGEKLLWTRAQSGVTRLRQEIGRAACGERV